MKSTKPLILGRLETLSEIKKAIEEIEEKINSQGTTKSFTLEEVEKIREFFGFK